LKVHPGAITDEELEKKNGGSGLRYSFDIKSGKAVSEVGVDAQTAKPLENAKEDPPRSARPPSLWQPDKASPGLGTRNSANPHKGA
jgi:hypothetical protein